MTYANSKQLVDQEREERRVAACVNAFEGIPTERIEGKDLGQILAGEMRLNGAGPRADGGVGFEFSGGVCQLMAEAYAEQFRQSGAINYLELLFNHTEIGPLTITMQRVEGLTPAKKLALAESERDTLQEQVAGYDDRLCKILPDCRYMDPPDGGSVPPIEQVERMFSALQEQVHQLNAEIARRDKAAGEPVTFDSLRDAVAEITGGIPHEFGDGHKGHDAVPFMNFNSLKRVVNKFAAQPAALPWHVDSCSNCGSKRLSWNTTVIKNTAVQDGLLKLNETSGLFYLGCDECSETLLKVSADDVANHLNNAKARGARPEKVVDLSQCRTLWYEHDDLSADVQCIPYSDLKKALKAAGVKWKEAE